MADSEEQASRPMPLRSDEGPTQTNPTNPDLPEDMADSGEQASRPMPLRSDGGVTQTNPTNPALTVVRTEFTDLECLDLADQICPDNDFQRLGHYLGFIAPALNRYRRENIGASCHGTYKMVVQWKKGFLAHDQREHLANALDNTGLRSLASKVRHGQTLKVVDALPPCFSSRSGMPSTSNICQPINPPKSLHSCAPGPEVSLGQNTKLPQNTEPSHGKDVEEIDLSNLSLNST